MNKASWVSIHSFSSVVAPLFRPVRAHRTLPSLLVRTETVEARLVLLVLRADVQFLLDLIRELLLSAAVLVNTRGTSGGGSVRSRGLDMSSWRSGGSACSTSCSNVWCKAVAVGVLVGAAANGGVSHSGRGVFGRDSRGSIVLVWRSGARGDGDRGINVCLGARGLVVGGVEAGSGRVCT